MQFVSSERKLRERFFASLDAIRDIPTFPRVAARLSAVMARPASTMREVADAIQQDPAVTARLLQLVNSAYYRRITGGVAISSVPFAVTRVGLEEIRNIVTTLSVFSLFPGAWADVDRVAFWRHCLETALAARLVRARALGPAAPTRDADDEWYAAGLLHDIGIVVLDHYFRPDFVGILSTARRSAVPLHEVEQAMAGIDHAAVGAAVARRWGLPAPIVAALEHHHDPGAAPAEHRALCAGVHLADYLCRAGEAGLVDREGETASEAALAALGLSVDDLDGLAAAAKTHADQAGTLAELAA